MVELIIKIPESEIPKRQEIIEMPIHFIDGKVCEAGGYEFDVLPKGHGRLGDLDKIIKEMQNYYDDCAKTSEYTRLGFETAIAVVEDADTVIEADKEKEK